MSSLITILFLVVTYSLLIGVAALFVTILEDLYCKCKPTYKFTTYTPKNPLTFLIWPLILPLLLIELLYIATYCLTQKLRKLL